MSENTVFAELKKDLNTLSIVPPNFKKGQLEVLGNLCNRYLNCMLFDSTALLDQLLTDDGGIINPKNDVIQFSISIIDDIIQAIADEDDFEPSDVVTVLDEECITIISDVQKNITNWKIIGDSMIALVISFTKTMSKFANSGNFDLDVVISFFQEVDIFLGLVIIADVANKLPKSWHDFRQLARNQFELIKHFEQAETYNEGCDILWSLNDITSFQKDFLAECIQESIGFDVVMSEVGPALDSMLSLQDKFIMKFIARLQASKTVQHTIVVNATEC